MRVCLPGVVVAALLSGCGGGAGHIAASTGANVSGRAGAILTVTWPVHVAPSPTRLIPAAAVQLVVVITRVSDGTTLATVDVPQGKTTTEIDALPADDLSLTASAVDANGVVDAEGATDFTTRAGSVASLKLTLDSTIDHLSITPDSATLNSGDDLPLDVNAVTTDGELALLTPSQLVWDVPSGGDTVSVDGDGTVTGGRPGTTYVRVTDRESHQSGYTSITVLPTLTTLDVSDISYTSGSNIATLSAYDDYGNLIDPDDLTWSTDNSAYHVADGANPQPLVVSSDAAPGTIHITATQISTGMTASYDLTIDVGPPTTLYASTNSITAGGDSVTVTLLSPEGYTYPSGLWSWSSDNGDVSVEPSGGDPVTLRADKAATGSVTVTVRLTGSPFEAFSGNITLPITAAPDDGDGRATKPTAGRATRLYAVRVPRRWVIKGVAHRSTRTAKPKRGGRRRG